jgi:hypothetical protein
MGLWFPAPQLRPSEKIRYSCVADLSKGRRQLGARITVSDQRLFIMPNRLDAITGGRSVSAELSELNGVRVEPPRTETARKRGLSAQLRSQVEIVLPDGVTAVVTVSNPNDLKTALGAI